MADEAPAAWPDPMKPGVPLNPDRDGWHWVSPGGCDEAFPAEWRVAGECERGRWAEGWIVGEDEHDPIACTYLGPCLTPFDLAARDAAARIAGREDVRAMADRMASEYVERLKAEWEPRGHIPADWLEAWQACADGMGDVADAAATLPLPPGADALAERIASAVAAERERCARLAQCGCSAEKRAAVIAVPPNSARRWNLCGEDTCGAIEAEAIRADAP